MKIKFTIGFILMLLITAKATHNRAGEILYKRIAPFTNVVNSVAVQVYTYSITIIKYTDHGSTVADRCGDTIYFGDGQKDYANRINGTFTCSCNGNGCGEIISSSPSYIVKRNVYSITHTYAGPGTYVLRSSDPNRNAGVHNIPNSVNTPFAIESILVINAQTGANSSPEFAFAPIGQAILNTCYIDNSGAFDVDGDSLSFEITPCLASGFFYPEITVPGGFFGINATTGLLTWCDPLFLDEYNIAFLVKEWRKNTSGVYQFNGQIMRDMQILVINGVVGLSQNSETHDILLYPNPVANQVKINLGNESTSKAECVVFDAQGKVVFSKNVSVVSKDFTLDVSALSPGIYFLQLNLEDKTIYKKWIKE